MYIKIGDRLKGILLAFLSAIAFANVYVLSKAALNQVSLITFGFYWFGISFLVNTLIFLHKNFWEKLKKLGKKEKFYLFIIVILEFFGTTMFFLSIKLVENPAIVYFLTNLIPVFVALLGFVFLNEKFSLWEYAGITIAIAGLILLGYKPGLVHWQDFFDTATMIILLSSLIFAINTVIIKKNIKGIHPLLISELRVLFLFVFFALYIIFTSSSIQIPAKALLNIVAGALLGPVFAVLISIYALKYIEATISSIIISTKSFITVIIVFLVFGLLPTNLQLIGGVLTVLGIVLISLGQHFSTKKKR